MPQVQGHRNAKILGTRRRLGGVFELEAVSFKFRIPRTGR